ncbi:predicted protein [Thalassiosira pseudonana CCMP1335]|uniref:Uncharacterized protein n=1 Tax=Thalassiosira pseudonana TaxID=35128 RepID=B8CD51_THAPS|nr:predicted protein [Thalassiosira pseudonana CCMP1335]EED88548.1 predicted protein [Thalassiosira pseudonana CCMP1335]
MTNPSSSSSSSSIVLSLAHLLQQHSLSYSDEKNALISTTASLVVQSMHQSSAEGGEVHMVLTGSPRPTFAETNAWLLEEQKLLSPVKKGGVSGGGSDDVEMTDAVDDEGDDTLLQDYTQDSSNKLSSTTNSNMNDLGGSPTKMGGSVLFHYKERKYSEGDTSGGKSGTAATTASAVWGYRAQLLQGTIDRPLWSQNRWTDGECLFSELVERCGLESFENVGGAGGSGSGALCVADAAAGGGSGEGVGVGLRKTTNLSAHLITVPAQSPQTSNSIVGMENDTAEEIARGILRFLKRKKSPVVSKFYILLPPLSMVPTRGEEGREEGRRAAIATQLKEACAKLEQYNDMIGMPKLMAGAEMEFVDVNV